jgi:hypothetical protein
MGMLQKLGAPAADEDGTLWVRHRVENGMVILSCSGHDFVKCQIKNGDAVVQIIDISTGVTHEANITLLCWDR